LLVLLIGVLGVSAKKSLICADPTVWIKDQYVVIYHKGTSQDLVDKHINLLKQSKEDLLVRTTYSIGSTFKGFAATYPGKDLDFLLEDPLIAEVHCDAVEKAIQTCNNVQNNPPSWGLARVSHEGDVANGLSDEYSFSGTGSGVIVYVIDTGIYIEHQDFETRATHGPNFVDSVATDENGHGTHCAGTIAGFTFGIAKGARVKSVKVLNKQGSGATSGVIKGIQYVTDEFITTGTPSIASLSLGSTSDGGKNAAIEAAFEAGVVVTVAAGNSNMDACSYYPASSPHAITVGASALSALNEEQFDSRASYSNWGVCVDLFAPGSSITSAGITSRTSSSVKSGTSMACPHVAGLAAVIMSQDPRLKPQQVKDRVIATAQQNLIQDVAGSPNKLLYNGCVAP